MSNAILPHFASAMVALFQQVKTWQSFSHMPIPPSSVVLLRPTTVISSFLHWGLHLNTVSSLRSSLTPISKLAPHWLLFSVAQTSSFLYGPYSKLVISVVYASFMRSGMVNIMLIVLVSSLAYSWCSDRISKQFRVPYCVRKVCYIIQSPEKFQDLHVSFCPSLMFMLFANDHCCRDVSQFFT